LTLSAPLADPEELVAAPETVGVALVERAVPLTAEVSNVSPPVPAATAVLNVALAVVRATAIEEIVEPPFTLAVANAEASDVQLPIASLEALALAVALPYPAMNEGLYVAVPE
jgi:hypothetical protein